MQINSEGIVLTLLLIGVVIFLAKLYSEKSGAVPLDKEQYQKQYPMLALLRRKWPMLLGVFIAVVLIGILLNLLY